MKVLIISAVFPPEPVVSAGISYEVARALSDNHNVTVLSPVPSRPAGYDFSGSFEIEKPFRHINLNSFVCPDSKMFGRFRESYSFGVACYKFIKENKKKIDVIYINTWPLAAQLWVVKAASWYNIPVVTHIQDIYPESLINKLPFLKTFFLNLLLPLDRYITQRSAKVVTISEGMGMVLTKTRLLAKSKIEVVYNWQDEKKYFVDKKKKNPTSPFTFMFLGSLSPSAAIEVIVKAFIMSGLKDCKLVIAGRGSEKVRLQNLAAQNPDINIEFVDAPAENVGELQSNSDILLLTLKRGVAKLALPSKLSAYLFSAKPIIGSVDYESDVAQVILNSDCGWVTEPESVEHLSKAMETAYQASIDELTAKGERGFKYAMSHFSRQNNLPKLVEIIEKALLL